ncbi:hypothetical protein COC42_04295 [Sphingomonas spermidinifaciens]|uniref:DUF4168 domain-containing protein n=1 Tax=Sphingomonas spermidinifaciens TaxID=1141889 RepID=A0A2A4B317_9SPHN|nr:DUF4168 domain-containing protein [Sphingomonas spermidinifaciens]PCD03593.1 hypothetical protein COC42_04295 [Sphingomonas spermidinifaciens]
MRSFTLAAAAIASTFAVAAGAQETPAAGAAPAQEAAPATGATPSASAGATATVSDAEVTQFATALAAVDKINKDAATPAAEKQAKMAEAVTSAGLTPERFNSIGQSLSKDPALQAKVAAAMQAKGGAPS